MASQDQSYVSSDMNEIIHVLFQMKTKIFDGAITHLFWQSL